MIFFDSRCKMGARSVRAHLLKSPVTKTGLAVVAASYLARINNIDAANLRCSSDWWSRCVLSTVNTFPDAMEEERAAVQMRNKPTPRYLDGLKGSSESLHTTSDLSRNAWRRRDVRKPEGVP